MKNIYPQYPRYPQDFISSFKCQKMTLEEFGAFNWLLDHSWVFSEKPCHLPNNPETLAWLLRSNCSAFAQLWVNLKEKFEETPDGKYIYNPRLLSEYNRLLNKSKQMADNALHASAKQKPNKSKAKAKQTDIDIEYETDIEKEIVFEFSSFRKGIGKPFKTKQGKEAFLKKLREYGNNDPVKMKQVIEQSISNEWQGIFPLKENANFKPRFGRQEVSRDDLRKNAEEALILMGDNPQEVLYGGKKTDT